MAGTLVGYIFWQAASGAIATTGTGLALTDTSPSHSVLAPNIHPSMYE